MAFAVHRALGPGLLESAYEGAYVVELTHSGLFFERQKVFPVVYRNEYVGAYIADWRKAQPFSLEESANADSSLVVDNTIIIELKSVSKINDVIVAQLLNYLKLSKLPVGYVINFHNINLEWKRLVNTRGG
jgi:hypothetical protein